MGEFCVCVCVVCMMMYDAFVGAWLCACVCVCSCGSLLICLRRLDKNPMIYVSTHMYIPPLCISAWIYHPPVALHFFGFQAYRLSKRHSQAKRRQGVHPIGAVPRSSCRMPTCVTQALCDTNLCGANLCDASPV